MIYKLADLDKLIETNDKLLIIYGGSFSPVHIYHEQIIINLLSILPKVKFVIVPVNDLYPKKDLIIGYNKDNVNHRIMMCELMILDIKNKLGNDIDICISDIAFKYNIPKVDRFVPVHLKELYPDYKCVFYFGQDILDSFDTWDKADKEAISDIIVHPRDNDVSSTNIKKIKKEENRLEGLIDPIKEYILKYNLF
jgi:nicotinic acid mononucleotide adenylyltransferase